MVNVQETSGITLRGSAIARTTLTEHAALSVGGCLESSDATAVAQGQGRGGEAAASEGSGIARAFV